MSRDFYELCYDQYKLEMKEADGLYQKAGMMLVVIPLLGVIVVKLGRLDIIHLCFTRVDAFFFYLASVLASVFLIVSVWFLLSCIYPRKYKTLASMDFWQKWRDDYQAYLDKVDDSSEQPNAIDAAMLQNLCPKLAEAQPVNAAINEKRRQSFRRSIKMAAIALSAIGVQAIFSLILALQGV